MSDFRWNPYLSGSSLLSMAPRKPLVPMPAVR